MYKISYLQPNLVAFLLVHGKHSFGKVLNEVWHQACELMRFIQQADIYILYQTYEFHLSHVANDNRKNKRFLLKLRD